MRVRRRLGAAVVALTVLSLPAAPVRAAAGSGESSHAVAWGYNKHGQLGNGETKIAQTTFVDVGAYPARFTDAAAGYAHSLAIAADRSVWSWGYNKYGQLGEGSTASRRSPAPVPGLTGVVGVAAGAYHSLALRSDGTVWAWGDNDRGQVGQDDTAADWRVPVQVPGLSQIVAIEAGTHHNLAVRSDGTVWAWGENDSGQLGSGSAGGFRSVPLPVRWVAEATAAAAGAGHSLVRRADGQVLAWGDNSSGQLGDGTTTRRLQPVEVAGGHTFAGIAAGEAHSLARTAHGLVWAWGSNTYGQLGLGDRNDRVAPDRAQVGYVTRIDAGSSFSLARRHTGALVAWGANGQGQLGDGTQLDRVVPVAVQGLDQVLGAASGPAAQHAFAIRPAPRPSPPQPSPLQPSPPQPSPPQVRIDLPHPGPGSPTR